MTALVPFEAGLPPMMRQDSSPKSLPAGFTMPVLDILHPTIGVRDDSGQVAAHAEPDHHRENQPSP
jgi:hypothetical protein